MNGRRRYVTEQPVPASGFGGLFWAIVDFNWTVVEQNRLVLIWKAGAR